MPIRMIAKTFPSRRLFVPMRRKLYVRSKVFVIMRRIDFPDFLFIA